MAAIVVAGLSRLGATKMLRCGGDGVGQLADGDVEGNTRRVEWEAAGQCGMVAVGQEEGGVARAGVGGIIVCDFDGGEVRVPVGLVIVDVCAKKGTEAAIDPFGLAVGLGMEGCGEPEGCTHLAEDGLPEVAEEARVAIGDDGFREAVVAEDFAEEEVGNLAGSGGATSRKKVCVLAEAIDHDEDAVKAVVREWQVEEVHCDLLPLPRGDGNGLEETWRHLVRGFGSLTDVTGVDVRTDVEREAGPVVGTHDEFRGLVASQMAGGGIVVAGADESGAESAVGGDPQATDVLVVV